MTSKYEEIKTRCEKATPGPWDRYGDYRFPIKPQQGSLEAAPGLSIGSVTHTEPIARFSGYLMPVEENADFCIHARTDIPLLLKALEIGYNDLGPDGISRSGQEAIDYWIEAAEELMRNEAKYKA
jgi:hypothetical protein